MSQLVALLDRTVQEAGKEVQDRARSASRRAIGFACLAFALGSAAVFGSVALFLALSPSLGGAGAAASVGGIWLFIGLVTATALLALPRPSPPSEILPSRQSLALAAERDARALSPWISVAAGLGAALLSASRGGRQKP